MTKWHDACLPENSGPLWRVGRPFILYIHMLFQIKKCVFAGPQAQSPYKQNAFEKNFHIACKQNKQRFLNFSTNQNGRKQSKQ